MYMYIVKHFYIKGGKRSYLPQPVAWGGQLTPPLTIHLTRLVHLLESKMTSF